MKVLSGRALPKAIRQILHGSGTLRCAVAFWGPDAAALAKARSGKVVLDVSMGGTSRNALRALGVPHNPNVRVLDGLHAKIYLAEGCAIIASANASCNALGSDHSRPVLEEAGVWIGRQEDPAGYRAAERLFGRYWKAASVAEPADLERAVRAATSLPARDRAPEANATGSVLDELLAQPESFAQTIFVFADSKLEADDRRLAAEAYANEPEAGGEDKRRLVCATYDKKEARALEDGTYVIMYWHGPYEGIYAYHDIVRVRLDQGFLALFGRRQWSTVRSRLGILGLSTLNGFWKADRRRSALLAACEGSRSGRRFVVMRHDEVYEALEADV